jgi:hypothetical protein
MNEPTWPGLGLFVLTGLAVLTAIAAAIWARRSDRPRLFQSAAIGAGAWCALYVVTLVVVSLTSTPRVLDADEPKAFCGFYLDCHISVALEGVEIAETLGPDASRAEPEGVFYIVALRYGSDAIEAHLSPEHPTAIVRDAGGRTFERSIAGERALSSARGLSTGEGRILAPGEFYVTHLVFDLPRDIEQPVLDVTSGWLVERIAELVLIGDEDSLFHARTVFRLSTS